MADALITVNVFKFVALRPSQLVDAGTSAVSQIRDARARNDETLKPVVGDIDRMKAGGGHPDQLLPQPGVLTELSEAVASALRQLAALDQDEEDFDPKAWLKGIYDLRAGGGRGADDAALLDRVWNAVYLAYVSGPDAGARLEVPLAALRWLHASALGGKKEIETPAELRTALTATPLIPHAVAALLKANGKAAPVTAPERDSEREGSGRRFERLIQEMQAAERLLTVARTTTPAKATVEETVANEGMHRTLRRADVTVGSVPRLSGAVAARPTEHERDLLQNIGVTPNTSLPAATRSLEAHLMTLNREAYALRENPAFIEAVVKSGYRPLLTLLPPIRNGLLEPGWTFPWPVRSTADVDVRGRIKPLGIGDLKVVKQTLLSYQAGEVAHIENVLKGESKERKHRTLDRTETTLFTSEEETTETERDTQSTDRFELKREAEQTIKQDMSVSAGLTVTGGFGPVNITAQGNFAYSTTQQESVKNSANFAREVVDRSVSKIQKKVKTERTTKTIHEVEEINSHGLENKEGAGHVRGVYRWVDKKYRAQVYNYGVRLLIEFVVPEPAAYFRASLEHAKTVALKITPPEPFLDFSGQPLTPSDMTPTNYQLFAARYNAPGVNPPPPEYTYIATAFEQSGLQNGQTFSKSVKEVAIPEGYIWDHYVANVSAIYENYPQFSLQIAGMIHHVLGNTTARRLATAGYGVYWGGDWEDDPRGIVPVSAIGYDIQAYTVHVEVTCRRTQELYEKWQLQTFDKIYTAYKALQTEYDQKLSQAQAAAGAVVIEGRNPALNREIEKQELKKLCITLLTGRHYREYDAMVHPTPPHLPEVDVLEALDEGPRIQFFEQAFDWEQITYLFYPYFWGNRSQWLATSNLYDPDPLFTHFLQAGAARVVVPVPMAYKDALLYFLETGGIWSGGETPRLDDPLYRSIHEELRDRTDDLAGATPEGTAWEFTLPTTLVWLQDGADLPVFGS